MVRGALVAAAVAAVAVAAGCGSGGLPPPEQAAAVLCDPPPDLAEDLRLHRANNPQTIGLAQMQDYLVNLDGWLTQVAEAAGVVDSPHYDEFLAATQEFGAVVRQLGTDGASNATNAADLRAAAQDVQEAARGLADDIDC